MPLAIDKEFLLQFCGVEPSRPYLHVPSNQDGFTWATNGHILVRVAEIEGLMPCSCNKPINISKPIVGVDEATFTAARWKLPPHDPSFKGPCGLCDGRGYLHKCPDCDCFCTLCNGSGEADPERRMSTSILGRIFALNYVRMIADLPGLEVAGNEDELPLFFRFEGGVGGIMPLRTQHESHIEVEIGVS